MFLFQLSDYVENKSNCIHCIMDKCSNKAHHKSNEIKKMSAYVNNPLLKEEIQTSISEYNDFIMNELGNCDKKILSNGLMYTTCLFCFSKKNYGKCKNAKEGRCGTCTLKNGEKVQFCYPDLKGVKHRIQIGLHIDFAIDSSGKVLHQYVHHKNKVQKSDQQIEVVQKNMNEVETDSSPYLHALKKSQNQIHNKNDEVSENKNDEVSENKNKSEELNKKEFYDKNEFQEKYIELQKKYHEENEVVKKIYERSKANMNSKESISLRAHIEYLQMKLQEKSIDMIDQEISRQFYQNLL